MTSLTYLGVDPGEQASGVVTLELPDQGEPRVVWSRKQMPNDEVLCLLRGRSRRRIGPVVIETMVPYGLTFGWSTLRTVMLTGQFIEASGTAGVQITRKEVLEILFGSKPKKPDSAVLALLQEEIGGKGTKGSPGPTHGVAGHAWQALGAVWAYLRQCGMV